MPHLKKAPTEDIKNLYQQGYSYAEIADMYGMSRQAVWERMKRANVPARAKKTLPFVMYDGIKFTVHSTTGYYRNTDRGSRGCAISLHRHKYITEIGEIPDDWDVHHIDLDRTNNDISNLIAMPKSEHTRLHQRLKRNEANNV